MKKGNKGKRSEKKRIHKNRSITRKIFGRVRQGQLSIFILQKQEAL